MVMLTRSAFRKSSVSFDSSDVTRNNIVPPWCSGKNAERKKPKKVPPPRKTESSYVLQGNIRDYINKDKRCCSRRKTERRFRSIPTPVNKTKWKTTAILLTILSITFFLSFLCMCSTTPESRLITRVIPKTKLTSLLGSGETAAAAECCCRMKYLEAALLRAEQALRSTLRVRRKIMLTVQSNKMEGSGYIEGASVSKGSGTTEWGGRVALWGVVPLWRVAPPPHTVLARRRPTPADCWPFSGSHGELVIDLPRKVRVRRLTVEHVRPDTALSAPKHFILYGILDNGTRTKAIDSQYRHNGPAKQYFTCLHTSPLQRLAFSVLSNQGNPTYTCVYRVHLYEYYVDALH